MSDASGSESFDLEPNAVSNHRRGGSEGVIVKTTTLTKVFEKLGHEAEAIRPKIEAEVWVGKVEPTRFPA
jgi:hypothetical protein